MITLHKISRLKKYYPVFGGNIVFLLFFLYGLINNLSFSYMGNTDPQTVMFIMHNFLGVILLFLGKILLIYFVVGLLSGLLGYIVIRSMEQFLETEIKNRMKLFINIGIVFIAYLPFFFRSLILYPQVYTNGFYNKNAFFRYITDFFANYISPDFFAIVGFFILSVLFIFVMANFFKQNRKMTLAIGTPVLIIGVLVNFMVNDATLPLKEHNQDSTHPNIILLASDALRPDHFSGYGYKRRTTPHIDTLIEQGISFANMNIEVPRTFPSWVSTLSGQYASTHGVRHMFPTSRDINKNFTSIVKVLNGKGYYTAAVTDYAGDIFTRIELGFDKVDTPYFNFNSIIYQAILDNHVFLMPFLTNRYGLDFFPVLKDSAYFCPPQLVTKRVKKTIAEARQRPFFITTFYSSTHFPYAIQYPYYKMYSKKNYDGPYKFLKQKIIQIASQKQEKISSEDIEQVRALYDGGVTAFDNAVGEILTYLKANNLDRNTIVIVLSDHGENLYEDELGMGHGEHFRGKYAITIPFILYYPQKYAHKKIIPDLARQVDIAPTILGLINEKKLADMEGESLLPLIKTPYQKREVYSYGETGIWFDNKQVDDLFFQKLRILYPDITKLSRVDMQFDNQLVLNDAYRDIIQLAKHRYISDGTYKLLYMPLKNSIKYELYNTLQDPHEKNNLVKRDKKNFERLKKELFKWITRHKDVIIKDDYVFPTLRY